MTKKSNTIILFVNLVLFSVLLCHADGADSAKKEDAFSDRRLNMVKEQIEKRGVRDFEVLKAMRKVPRHLFVPFVQRLFSYSDRPLLIGHGQTISQPYIVAFMSEAARLKRTDKVLEIGTGSGYQAAVLAEIVDHVYTIEIIEGLATSAAKRLTELGYSNITVKHGDGYQGWKEYAPFDAIVVTAAPDKIPPKLIEQLKVGGRMVIPVGTVFQELLRITKTAEGLKEERLLPVRFVPMIESTPSKRSYTNE